MYICDSRMYVKGCIIRLMSVTRRLNKELVGSAILNKHSLYWSIYICWCGWILKKMTINSSLQLVNVDCNALPDITVVIYDRNIISNVFYYSATLQVIYCCNVLPPTLYICLYIHIRV